MRLLLFGCTGFIGKALIPSLLKAGHELTVITRKERNQIRKNSQKGITYITIDPSLTINWTNTSLLNAVSKVEGIINLAGEPIAEKRWSITHRELIKDSRLNTTSQLIKSIKKLKNPPKILISGSAIGFYGTSQNKEFTEESSFGEDFLAKLCKEWETLANDKPKNTRLVILRIGIVLGKDGGALGKMLPIFKAGLGGPIGSGSQWMSWIHINDICNLIENSLSNKSYSGVINAVAPNPVRMNDFARCIGRCIDRPSLIAVPGPILKIILGDGAKVVLEGQKVVSRKIQNLKYDFKYKTIKDALEAELK
tara:strand:+ start:3614 stop:4540 length:927 start_codon:yes stop_codon:yes gene_type:complete